MSEQPLSPELLNLVRRHSRGETSPRRHQASRARVLDRFEQRQNMPTGLAVALAALVVGGGGAAMFAGAKAISRRVTVAATTAPKNIENFSTKPGPVHIEDAPPRGEQVQLQVVPKHATIYWDEKKQAENPASFPFVPDNQVHRVRAEAPGYLSKTQLVSMNGPNVLITLELQPLPISMGPISTSGSAINADQIVEGRRNGFHACYADALVQTPTLAGKATIVLELGEGGRVKATEIVDQEGLNEQVTTCLASRASEIGFRVGGKGWVKIPLAFRNQ